MVVKARYCAPAQSP